MRSCPIDTWREPFSKPLECLQSKSTGPISSLKNLQALVVIRRVAIFQGRIIVSVLLFSSYKAWQINSDQPLFLSCPRSCSRNIIRLGQQLQPSGATIFGLDGWVGLGTDKLPAIAIFI